MPLRGGLPGFYEEGRPDLTVLYPPLQTAVHVLAGCFLDSSRPAPEDHWRAEAEVRYIAASAVAARLPWDSPPEVVELAAMDKEGNLLAASDYGKAVSAAISARGMMSET